MRLDRETSPKGETGASLLELLLAMFIFAIMIMGTFMLWERSQQTALRGTEAAEARQNARAVLNSMTREIRQAGSIQTADANRIVFREPGTNTQITYELVTATGCALRCVRVIRGSETPQFIADHIVTNGLQFTYLDANGNTLATPVSATDLPLIQEVIMRLDGQMVFPDPDPAFRFDSSAKLRNR